MVFAYIHITCTITLLFINSLSVHQGRRFMGPNGLQVAATIIQAMYRRYHDRVNYLDYRRKKWAAGVIALSWIMHVKMAQVRIKLREARIEQLDAFRRRSLVCTCTHAHTCTHTRTHARVHACTHTHAHTHSMHACTHTNIYLVVFDIIIQLLFVFPYPLSPLDHNSPPQLQVSILPSSVFSFPFSLHVLTISVSLLPFS